RRPRTRLGSHPGSGSRHDGGRSRRMNWSRTRRFAGLAVTLLACAGLMSASASGRAVTPKPTLTGGAFAVCGAMDPVLSPSFDENMVYEALIHRNPDGTLGPGLASSWRVGSGNKVITLTLRRNARFSDGTPVDAHAVKTWLDYRASLTAGVDNSSMG